MKKGQKSVMANYQNILCPFTYMYVTQNANGNFSHQKSTALDIRGEKVGVKYSYYAPVKVKCVNIDKTYAFVWWQSVNKVRFADGTIDYATFLCGHDESINAYKGMIIDQGVQMGNMGKGGNATGVHCHIEVGRGKQMTWKKNTQGVWCIPNQVNFEKVFFMDNTIIKNCNKNWKYIKDIKLTNLSTNSTYYKKYTGISTQIDIVFKAIGVSSKYYGSWKKRKPIALKNGILSYIGTTSQNLKLIQLAKQGKLKKV